jgi:hypothetical protein
MSQREMRKAMENAGSGYREYLDARDVERREAAFVERVKMGFTNFLAILAALLVYHWLAKYI